MLDNKNRSGTSKEYLKTFIKRGVGLLASVTHLGWHGQALPGSDDQWHGAAAGIPLAILGGIFHLPPWRGKGKNELFCSAHFPNYTLDQNKRNLVHTLRNNSEVNEKQQCRGLNYSISSRVRDDGQMGASN